MSHLNLKNKTNKVFKNKKKILINMIIYKYKKHLYDKRRRLIFSTRINFKARTQFRKNFKSYTRQKIRSQNM